MKIKDFEQNICLQLFAEGAGSDGGAADGAAGVTGQAPAAQQVSQQATEPAADFESLIKGKYKADFDRKMQSVVQSRLRSSKEKADRYDRAAPLLEAMAQRYGVKDATDLDALHTAFDEDRAALEAEAVDSGVSVEELLKSRRMERENLRLRRQVAEHEAALQYSDWLKQAETAKTVYPALDLETELQSPQFVGMLRSGVGRLQSRYDRRCRAGGSERKGKPGNAAEELCGLGSRDCRSGQTGGRGRTAIP